MATNAQLLQQVLDQQKTILEQVNSMHRGIYGDKANGVKGLIQRQDDDDMIIKDIKDRLSKVETFKKNTLKAWGLFWASFGAGGVTAWEKVLEILHLK